jgi:hypothetical protein
MQLQVIIAKQTVSEGFFVMLRGHKPNSEFKSFVSRRLPDYQSAFWSAQEIAHALILTGNETKLVNDRWAADDGKTFCELMAFEKLDTIEG